MQIERKGWLPAIGASLPRPFIGLAEDGTLNRKYLLRNEGNNDTLSCADGAPSADEEFKLTGSRRSTD